MSAGPFLPGSLGKQARRPLLPLIPAWFLAGRPPNVHPGRTPMRQAWPQSENE